MNEQKKTYFETSGYGFGFGNGSGNGDGYGYGNGEGYGYGYGFGFGNGFGNSNGFGNGYGNGNGNGSGSVYGSGSGSGCGYGNGYGYGSGSGNGDGSVILLSSITAYHIVSGTNRHAGVLIFPQYNYNAGENIRLCLYGLHASLDLKDARRYASGTETKVLCSGRVIFGNDKLVCEHREVVEVL
jgi:hypothetical protein